MSETSIEALLSHLGEHEQKVGIVGPNSGRISFELPQFTANEVVAAIGAARDCQPDWQEVKVRDRADVLLRLHDRIIAQREQLIDLLQFEAGKARVHGFEEVAGAMSAALYYGKTAAKTLQTKRIASGAPTVTRNLVDFVPVGVVGVITPWNYPLALTAMDVLPALAAGNTVVQKIDNQTALCALYLRQLAIDAGLPEEVWTIVVGDGAEVGNAITDHVDYVAFTGSTATGRVVARRASERLIGYSLELGGKNPLIVLPGANLAKAAEIAMGAAIGNAGQLCVAIERIYVAEASRAEFLKLLSTKLQSLKIGKSSKVDRDLGVLTSEAQLKRVQSMVQDAVTAGATLVTGGQHVEDEAPYTFSPALLTDIPETARLHRSEVFGPVLQVYGYQNLDEAVADANDSEYGLNASVVGDNATALKVARQLNAGSVNINEGYRASFAAMSSPMGGFKQSGHGRRNGPGGLLRFTESRAIGIATGFIKLPTRAKNYPFVANLMFALSRIKRRL